MAFESYQNFERARKFLGNDTYKNMHFPFHFQLPGLWPGADATTLQKSIHGWLDLMPNTGVPSWVLSNHDWPRLCSRAFPEFSETSLMVELLLPGVVSIYYGEEICMKDSWIKPQIKRDPRDSFRTPMQWDDSLNAGFTTKKEPWLPVNPEYWNNNVKKQLEDQKSHLKTFKRLMKLRKSPVIKEGQLESCVITPSLFLFQRSIEHEPPIVVIVNMGTETEVLCVRNCNISLPHVMKVHTASIPSGYSTGDEFTILNASGVACSALRPKAGVVLTTADNPEANHVTTLSHSLSLTAILLLVALHLLCQ